MEGKPGAPSWFSLAPVSLKNTEVIAREAEGSAWGSCRQRVSQQLQHEMQQQLLDIFAASSGVGAVRKLIAKDSKAAPLTIGKPHSRLLTLAGFQTQPCLHFSSLLPFPLLAL